MRRESYCLLVFLVSACSPAPAATSTPDAVTASDASANAGDSAVADAATPDAATAQRTLANCGGKVDAQLSGLAKLLRCATVSQTAESLVVAADGLPPHPTAYYASGDPNHAAFDTAGGTKKQNPNTLKKSPTTFTIPRVPVAKGLTVTAAMVDGQANTSAEEYKLGPAGIALDGVLLFNATAAPGADIANEAFTFDSYGAHPAPGGEYHYHGPSQGPLEALAAAGLTTQTVPGKAEVEVYGIMCDGTVVLGCTEADGKAAPTTGLDAQGGHVHDILGKDGAVWFSGRYHVHMCAATGRKYTPEVQYYKVCGVAKG